MSSLIYTDGLVALYCGDFRDVLPTVLSEFGAPDLTVADPPYEETSHPWDRWPVGWPALSRKARSSGSTSCTSRRRQHGVNPVVKHRLNPSCFTGAGWTKTRRRVA